MSVRCLANLRLHFDFHTFTSKFWEGAVATGLTSLTFGFGHVLLDLGRVRFAGRGHPVRDVRDGHGHGHGAPHEGTERVHGVRCGRHDEKRPTERAVCRGTRCSLVRGRSRSVGAALLVTATTTRRRLRFYARFLDGGTCPLIFFFVFFLPFAGGGSR